MSGLLASLSGLIAERRTSATELVEESLRWIDAAPEGQYFAQTLREQEDWWVVEFREGDP
jgi:hypothetical protein